MDSPEKAMDRKCSQPSRTVQACLAHAEMANAQSTFTSANARLQQIDLLGEALGISFLDPDLWILPAFCNVYRFKARRRAYRS